MKHLLDQIEASLTSEQYFLSLYTTLTIPDIAGALESDNGQATDRKYIEWYEAWARPQFWEITKADIPVEHLQHMEPIENPFTGEACYRFRCSLLHQGSAKPHEKSPLRRIIFIEPGATTTVVHYGRMGDDVLVIDLKRFCLEVLQGARAWLESTENSDNFQRNIENFARRHSGGLKPYIVGVPVVG